MWGGGGRGYESGSEARCVSKGHEAGSVKPSFVCPAVSAHGPFRRRPFLFFYFSYAVVLEFREIGLLHA